MGWHYSITKSEGDILECKCTLKTLTVTAKSGFFFFFLNGCGSFASSGLPAAHSPPPVQKKHHHRHPALSEGPPPCGALPLPEVGGGPRGNGLKLLPQQPRLPQQRQGVAAHQDHHPELPAQQREPPPRAEAGRGNPLQQVGRCRGNKDKVGHRHGQDEEEEEAVVAPADAAVEEEAVVVVVLDAQAAEFAVFRAVGKKQLWVKEWGRGLNSVIKQTHTSMSVRRWIIVEQNSLERIYACNPDTTENTEKSAWRNISILLHSRDRTCEHSGSAPPGRPRRRSGDLRPFFPAFLGCESEPCRTNHRGAGSGALRPGPEEGWAAHVHRLRTISLELVLDSDSD